MKKMYLLLIIFASFIALLTCENMYNDIKDEIETCKTYAIGDTGPSGVGLVFYITDGGLHGLEAAPSDQSTSQAWIAGGTTQTTLNGNTSLAIGTGMANSLAIIAQTGHTASAAKVCRDYTGGGRTDWFLPSKDELNLIYKNLFKAGLGGFESSNYWSSSESESTAKYAQYQYFSLGSQSNEFKYQGLRVRAVRAF